MLKRGTSILPENLAVLVVADSTIHISMKSHPFSYSFLRDLILSTDHIKFLYVKNRTYFQQITLLLLCVSVRRYLFLILNLFTTLFAHNVAYRQTLENKEYKLSIGRTWALRNIGLLKRLLCRLYFSIFFPALKLKYAWAIKTIEWHVYSDARELFFPPSSEFFPMGCFHYHKCLCNWITMAEQKHPGYAGSLTCAYSKIYVLYFRIVFPRDDWTYLLRGKSFNKFGEKKNYSIYQKEKKISWRKYDFAAFLFTRIWT